MPSCNSIFLPDKTDSLLLSGENSIQINRSYSIFLYQTNHTFPHCLPCRAENLLRTKSWNISAMKSVRPSYIRKADIGVVMENTNDSLKAVADYITASVDDDGVYCALKKWVFDAAE